MNNVSSSRPTSPISHHSGFRVLAGIDIPPRGLGTHMYLIESFLRRHPNKRWPLAGHGGWDVMGMAFKLEADRNEFVRMFAGQVIEP